jgi:hypothetical protein
MRRALATSIAMHGIAGAVVLALSMDRPEPPIVRERAAIAVEVLEPIPIVEHAGGAPRPAVSSPASAPSAPRRHAASSRVAQASRSARPASMRDLVAGAGIDGAPGGHGRGGAGAGTGTGIGFGDGGGLARIVEPMPAPPPPPTVSLARPARLIYPSREADGPAEDMYTARITVDHDGYVVGAKIVHGSLGPRFELASDLIFRFRYAPALDDDGRPIQTTLDQIFLVGR